MKEIRAIIIEDEKPAIEELKYVLSKYNFLNIVDVAMTGNAGYELVKKITTRSSFYGYKYTYRKWYNCI